nr:hypothetical protein [uncultured Acetatifactor sp.]
MLETMGWISLVPITIAIILALVTKNTVFSLIVACIVGVYLSGGADEVYKPIALSFGQ